jgi:hypothetical protein
MSKCDEKPFLLRTVFLAFKIPTLPITINGDYERVTVRPKFYTIFPLLRMLTYLTQGPIGEAPCIVHTIEGLNLQGREADHSPPSSTEVKNYSAIPPLPHTSSWRSV